MAQHGYIRDCFWPTPVKPGTCMLCSYIQPHKKTWGWSPTLQLFELCLLLPGMEIPDLSVCPCQHGAHCVQHPHAASCWSTLRNVTARSFGHIEVMILISHFFNDDGLIPRGVIVYLAGVVFGSVGGSLPNPTSYLAGASAGVYALIAAHVSTLVCLLSILLHLILLSFIYSHPIIHFYSTSILILFHITHLFHITSIMILC